MSFPTTEIDNSITAAKHFLPKHFWNGLFLGTSLWAVLAVGAIFTDCALKLIT